MNIKEQEYHYQRGWKNGHLAGQEEALKVLTDYINKDPRPPIILLQSKEEINKAIKENT